MDTLSFDLLSYICRYLNLRDLATFSKLGPNYHDAAEYHALRRNPRHDVMISRHPNYDELSSYCDFIALFTTNVRLELDVPEVHPPVVAALHRLFENAKKLDTLSVRYPSEALCPFEMHALQNVRCLSINNAARTDDQLACWLQACCLHHLRELTLIDMWVDGTFLHSIGWQLESLRLRSLISFNPMFLERYVKRCPLLRRLNLEDGGDTDNEPLERLRLSTLVAHLQMCEQLTLLTYGGNEYNLLVNLSALRMLRIRVASYSEQPIVDALMKPGWLQLEFLYLDWACSWCDVDWARALPLLKRLRVLVVVVSDPCWCRRNAASVTQLDALIVGVGQHKHLHVLQVTGGRPFALEPLALCVPHLGGSVRRLRVSVRCDVHLQQLANLVDLVELQVCVVWLPSSLVRAYGREEGEEVVEEEKEVKKEGEQEKGEKKEEEEKGEDVQEAHEAEDAAPGPPDDDPFSPRHQLSAVDLEQFHHFNRLVQRLVWVNTLHTLTLEFPYNVKHVHFDSETLEAMWGFDALRNLVVVGPLDLQSVRGVLSIMNSLEIFENHACSLPVHRNRYELRSLRPYMRVIFDFRPVKEEPPRWAYQQCWYENGAL